LKKGNGFSITKTLFVSINIAVVISLLFSLLASRVPPSTSTLFSVFGLLYPIILIVNILFSVVWILFRSKMFLLSLLTILFGFGNLTQNIQLLLPSSTQTPAGAIQLITYNVERFGLSVSEEKFRETKKEVLQYVKNENPEIVCLQEFHGKGETLYKPLQEIKKELGAITYYYESYFNPRYQQLTGLVIFSKYKAVGIGKLKFDGSRTFGIYTDLIIDEDTVRVYNIHFASIQLMPADIDFVSHPGQDKEARLHALKIYSKLAEAFQLREQQMTFLMEKIKNSPHPIILAGDFNDTPSSFVYNTISSILQDCFVEKGSGIGRTYAGNLPLLRIDFVMKSREFSTLNYKRHKIHFSDHFPVSVILEKN
jgi:endonuclease/exonuclease/phosphatase family metal-dependent hydrolase